MEAAQINIFNPLFSIIILFYNQQQYVNHTLKSVINQLVSKEIICVDDGSTDNTYNILKQYKNIKIIHHKKNEGIVKSRYDAIKQCKGKYIIFVDGDDELLPNSLVQLIPYCKMNIDIIEYELMDSDDKLLYNFNNELLNYNLLIAHNQRIIKNTLSNKAFSNTVVQQALKDININIEHDNYSDVLCFLYPILIHTNTVAQVDICCYKYYHMRGTTYNDNGISHIKHYCNFIITYNDLCSTYGETKTLFFWKNIVANQAIVVYLSLTEEDKEQAYPELLRLIDEDTIQFLIKEHLNNQ